MKQHGHAQEGRNRCPLRHRVTEARGGICFARLVLHCARGCQTALHEPSPYHCTYLFQTLITTRWVHTYQPLQCLLTTVHTVQWQWARDLGLHPAASITSDHDCQTKRPHIHSDSLSPNTPAEVLAHIRAFIMANLHPKSADPSTHIRTEGKLDK